MMTSLNKCLVSRNSCAKAFDNCSRGKNFRPKNRKEERCNSKNIKKNSIALQYKLFIGTKTSLPLQIVEVVFKRSGALTVCSNDPVVYLMKCI